METIADAMTIPASALVIVFGLLGYYRGRLFLFGLLRRGRSLGAEALREQEAQQPSNDPGHQADHQGHQEQADQDDNSSDKEFDHFCLPHFLLF